MTYYPGRMRVVERVLEALDRGVIPWLENPWVALLSFRCARTLVNLGNDD